MTVGFPENPWPGSEGITTSNASSAFPPKAVGSVSGPMIFSCSMIEPGQPCVTISGKAFWCFERTWMKWMSDPIDFGDELRQGVQFRFNLSPVVICRPIARERLHRCELHALRFIRDRFPFRPFRRRDAGAQIGECGFGDVDVERTNGVGAFVGHGSWLIGGDCRNCGGCESERCNGGTDRG